MVCTCVCGGGGGNTREDTWNRCERGSLFIQTYICVCDWVACLSFCMCMFMRGMEGIRKKTQRVGKEGCVSTCLCDSLRVCGVFIYLSVYSEGV